MASNFPPRPPTASSPSIANMRSGRSDSASRGGTPEVARLQTERAGSSGARATTPVLGELPTPMPPSSSARQTTPNKTNTISSRSSTPNKEANSKVKVRPSSAGRSDLTLQKASFDVQQQYRERAQSTRTSTRKLRRWENDHPAMTKEDIISMLGEGGDDAAPHGPVVDWRSLFSKLFIQKNWSCMNDFRQCVEVQQNTAATTYRRLRTDYWKEAEEAWLKVEKRLRSAVQDTILVKPDMFAFVESLEAVLMYFAEKLEATPAQLTPPLLADMIAEPLTVEKHVAKSSSKSKKAAATRGEEDVAAEVKPARGSLRVNIKDGTHAAFYRIFVHATCQFYGFQSRSVNEGTARVTLITPPTRVTAKNTPMLAARLSLAAFLTVLVSEAKVPVKADASDDVDKE